MQNYKDHLIFIVRFKVLETSVYNKIHTNQYNKHLNYITVIGPDYMRWVDPGWVEMPSCS